MKHYEVKLDGRRYTWNGKQWFESATFATPPASVIHKLNWRLKDLSEQDDLRITDVRELLKMARYARENGQPERSEKLARRALKLESDNIAATTVLCATLRAQKRPRDALSETEAFRNSGNSILLTSRAAAYCDLGHWHAAKREIGYALSQGESDHAFNVVERIKSARPDLY